MILQTAALLTAIGFIAFAAGHMTGHPGVSMIGAIIIIGLGASMMTTGLEAQTGQFEEVVNTTDGQNVTVEHEYSPVEISTSFPFDAVTMLLGAVMLIRSTGRASETDLEEER